ncbi:hypothetical protein C8Q72DRAFT_564058 [Fomitopsis betulina]|nr:hypothetical protein C8Q72DRAFT_564058 [Fomitopsis betulina]
MNALIWCEGVRCHRATFRARIPSLKLEALGVAASLRARLQRSVPERQPWRPCSFTIEDVPRDGSSGNQRPPVRRTVSSNEEVADAESKGQAADAHVEDAVTPQTEEEKDFDVEAQTADEDEDRFKGCGDIDDDATPTNQAWKMPRCSKNKTNLKGREMARPHLQSADIRATESSPRPDVSLGVYKPHTDAVLSSLRYTAYESTLGANRRRTMRACWVEVGSQLQAWASRGSTLPCNSQGQKRLMRRTQSCAHHSYHMLTHHRSMSIRRCSLY